MVRSHLQRPAPREHGAQIAGQGALRCAFPCGAATPRLSERGTARGRREPPCPSCACAKATLTPSRIASGFSPASARTSARKASMRWSIGFPRRTACPSPPKGPAPGQRRPLVCSPPPHWPRERGSELVAQENLLSSFACHLDGDFPQSFPDACARRSEHSFDACGSYLCSWTSSGDLINRHLELGSVVSTHTFQFVCEVSPRVSP